MGKQKTSSAPSANTASSSKSNSKSKSSAPEPPQATKPASRGPPRAKIVRSGNAGNSASSASASAAKDTAKAPDDGRPAPLFPAGYKTPLSLLNERCQKNGWQKPDVQPFKTVTGYSCAVKLTKIDLKRGAETITLQPPTESESPIKIEKETSLEAKHWGAVYALHRFASMLQLGMILPPQCRDYWAALQADKKAAPPQDAWKWAADPFEAASSRTNSRSATPTPRDNAASSSANGEPGSASSPLGKDLPEVRMSQEMRALVQSTIRTMRKLHPPSGGPDSSPPYSIDPVEASKIMKSLKQLGYREGHIKAAIHYISNTSASCDPLLEGLSQETLQNTVIQYLQITLTEDELPDSHGGNAGGKLDAGIRVAIRENSAALAESWKIEKLVKETGYPETSVAKALREAASDEALTVEILARRLVGWQDEWSDEAVLSEASTEKGSKELKARRHTEIEALQSILGPIFNTIDDTTFEVDIAPSRVSLQLRVLMHAQSSYPSPSARGEFPSLPTFYLCSADNEVPPYIRLHLVARLLQRLRDEEQPDWLDLVEAGEGGLIYEMVTFLEDIIDGVLSHPPPASDVLRHLTGVSEEREAYTRSGNAKSSGASMGHRINFPVRAQSGSHDNLLREHRALESTSEYQTMLSKRKTLPAWKSKQQLIDLVSQNRVVIVSGATGSGKTTQVPAFILENEILNLQGGNASIICTQPRRISAIGVATRVAQERTEKVGENLVGYAIRGERKASKNCKLLFCTTGILLQRISRGGDPNLQGVSHVFVDEVHERSLDSDFLLLILKDLLERNKTIKVVLMSATADSLRFSSYFGGAPCIEIPGQTHPVQDFYMEDVIAATKYKAPSIKASRTYTQEENDALKQSFLDQGIVNPDEISTLSMMARAEKIDYDLIAATVDYLTTISDKSEAILIFVTGVAEITATIRAIERTLPSNAIEVLPLHANLSSAEQSKIFKQTSRRKIIVATNVAETSITVDDVVFVIDTGRVKETRFDAEKGLVKLVEDWNSLAGSKQRRGRAGRTKPGKCYKLFTRFTERMYIPAQSQPEILRTPLASLILQIKSLIGKGNVVEFLNKALDCPQVTAIQEALDTLERLGAMEEGDSKVAHLTPLGQNLALLPLDLRLGKMLIFASIFDCLDSVLTICAALSTKPLFTAPPEKRDDATSARLAFSRSHSDILTDLGAIEAAMSIKEQSKLRRFCEDNFISQSALREVVSLRIDYISALKQAGFILPPGLSASMSALKISAPGDGGNVSELNKERKDNLIKAIVYAGTVRAVRVKLPQARYEATIGGTSQLDHESKEIKYFDTDGRVFIHPSSIMFKETKLKNGYLTYFNKSVTSKPFLRDASELPLYSLLIFGRGLKADALRGGLALDDGKIRLRAPPRTSILINELRRLLDVELAYMIDDPESTRDNKSPVIRTMMTLLERDGS